MVLLVEEAVEAVRGNIFILGFVGLLMEEGDIMEDIKKHVKIITYVIILLVLGILWVNAGFISNFLGFTGKVAGTVNLTVQKLASYNLTVDNINWSYGQVDDGQSFAILATTNGTVENGNWTPVTEGFVVQNDGNVDLVLDISFGKVAADFIGGTSPEYAYNITNNESNSCTVAGGFTLGDWNEVTVGTINICSNLSFDDEVDEIRIDFLLKIPEDSYIDARGDTLTVSVEAM